MKFTRVKNPLSMRNEIFSVLGLPKEQRVYLKPGDVVTIEIDKLGALINRMVGELSQES